MAGLNEGSKCKGEKACISLEAMGWKSCISLFASELSNSEALHAAYMISCQLDVYHMPPLYDYSNA